jgi:DNA anti-recombination protein RmuC
LSKIHEIETNVNQTKEFLKSIKTSDKQYKVLVDQLTKLSGSVNQSINKFKEEKKKITDLLNITNIFYLNKYLPLVKKLDDPETGLSVKLKEANSLSKEISHVEASCKDQYGKIKKFTDGYVKTEKNLEKLETSIK